MPDVTLMNAIPVTDAHDPDRDQPPGFWRKAVRHLDVYLDAYLVNLTRRAISPVTLRRCRRDVARCRRLMSRLDGDAAEAAGSQRS
jgi:hypothetical protein